MNEIFLSNIDGDRLRPPLQLFWRSELFDEIAALEDMLFPDAPVPRRKPSCDIEEWAEIMLDLLHQIPSAANGIDRLKLAAWPSSPGGKALRWRIRQTLQALGPLPQLPSEAHPPAGVLPSHQVLLPMRLKARLERLLDFSSLPMAWVRSIDLAQMPAPQIRPERPPE